MNDLPEGAGAAAASLAAALIVLIITAAMIASAGGLQRPLTAPRSVAMSPDHARQG